jgi:hypothetical protein
MMVWMADRWVCRMEICWEILLVALMADTKVKLQES